MHWKREHVDPMLALRNIVCSDRWDQEWPKIARRLRQQVILRKKLGDAIIFRISHQPQRYPLQLAICQISNPILRQNLPRNIPLKNHPNPGNQPLITPGGAHRLAGLDTSLQKMNHTHLRIAWPT
jgi:hypothetical protein